MEPGRANAMLFLITRYDDLLEEENEAVQIALKRLSAKEAYERVYRIRRSVQCSYTHKLLPKDQWTKPEEVRLYPRRDIYNYYTIILYYIHISLDMKPLCFLIVGN
jgi:hypothetical protein